MKNSRGAATSVRTAAAPAAGTRLSAGGAFALNACFAAGLLVLTKRYDNRRRAADYQFILRGSKGPLRDRQPERLYARACDQGWPGTCSAQ